MKALFLTLLAVNALVFALFQAGGTRSGEPMKEHEPYQSEQIRLLSAVELKDRKAPIPEQEKSAPIPLVASSQQCLEWEGVAADDMERAKQSLQKLKLWDKATSRKLEKASGFWVYVPPRTSLAEAQKKVGELKSRGVGESFILQENGAWRYAISLGVFSTAEAAAKYLAQLREKGVRSAVAGPRTREMDASIFSLKNLDPATAAEVAKLKQTFPGSEVKTVECR
jgi:hypothetical protein